MRILLVNPPRFEGLPVIREERCEITERYSVLEPYSLLQLGGILRKSGHKIKIIDANGFDLKYRDIKSKILAFRPNVVIFRFTPTTFDHDMRTCKLVKKISDDIRTIGLCWTLHTEFEDVMDFAKALDFFVLGDYESAVPQLVDELAHGKEVRAAVAWRENGKIIHNQPSKSTAELDFLPMPAYDLLPSLKPYFINTPTKRTFTIMYTSRGCPYKCIYCTVAGTKWKARSAKSVVKELIFLKKNYNIGLVSFFDETFTIDRKRTADICKKIIEKKLGIEWYCNTRANLLDKELIDLMARAGCTGMSIGVESGSQKILDMASKGIKVEEARESIKAAKEAGIKVLCSFIFGLPGEDRNTIDETIRFVKETLPTGAQFNVAVPYPGTGLYDWAISKGLLKKMNWRELYQHSSIVGTDELSPEELDEARMNAYKSLYTNPRWYISNVKYVIRRPSDAEMAFNFTIKIINNLALHRMRDSH